MKAKKYFYKNWQLWVMLFPAMLYIFIFCYVPMYGIQLAFRDYDFTKGIAGGAWAGLKYFKQYFESPMFLVTLKNTFVIAFASIVVGFPVPIILAMVINQLRNKKWKRVVQTTVYIPYFISVVVMVSILRIMLADGTGVIDGFLKGIHLVNENINLMGSEKAFMPVYVLSGVWQTMLHVDLPAILPTIMIVLILNMGNILNVGFDKVFLMQNSLNLGASQVISTYVYTVGIKSTQFSFGAAVGLFNTVINFVFLIVTNHLSKKVTGTGLM